MFSPGANEVLLHWYTRSQRRLPVRQSPPVPLLPPSCSLRAMTRGQLECINERATLKHCSSPFAKSEVSPDHRNHNVGAKFKRGYAPARRRYFQAMDTTSVTHYVTNAQIYEFPLRYYQLGWSLKDEQCVTALRKSQFRPPISNN